MLGRKEELNCLNELYNSDYFEYLVMCGRRRVGKITICRNLPNIRTQSFFLLEKRMMRLI